MRKPTAVSAAVVAAAFMVSSCYTVMVQPVPEPETRESLDIRGVVFGEGPDRETFQYSEVHGVQWTETALVITGVVHAPGEPEDGQINTTSFPLSDVSDVLVMEVAGTRLSIIVAAVIVGAAAAITFAITGKTVDGGPVGGSR